MFIKVQDFSTLQSSFMNILFTSSFLPEPYQLLSIQGKFLLAIMLFGLEVLCLSSECIPQITIARSYDTGEYASCDKCGVVFQILEYLHIDTDKAMILGMGPKSKHQIHLRFICTLLMKVTVDNIFSVPVFLLAHHMMPHVEFSTCGLRLVLKKF